MARYPSSAAVAGALIVAATVATAATSAAERPPQTGEAWIVYNGGVGSGSGIRIVRPDGSGDRSLFEGLVTGEAWHPDWSHDGERVAFAVDDPDGTRDLWVGTVDGSLAERLYDCTSPCSWSDDPAWSADDRKLLFQQGAAVGSEGLGVSTLEILELESGEVRTVVSGGAGDYFYVPRWAPDSERIVVEVDRFDSARLDATEVIATSIATVNISDPEPSLSQLVTDRRAIYPDWSPDGDTIVFQAPVDRAAPDGPSDLYVVPAIGGEPVRLTSIGGDGRQALQPSWTLDGRVIFVEQDAMFENVRMAVIDVDGKNVTSATGDRDMFGTHPRLRP